MAIKIMAEIEKLLKVKKLLVDQEEAPMIKRTKRIATDYELVQRP